MTITFPADFTAEKFPQIISTLVESGESREWIEKFVFHGKQRIVLLLDENERLIRVSYDGEAGISEDKLRRVSVVWRSFREKGIRRDKLVMKTPSVSGYDRNNPKCHFRFVTKENRSFYGDTLPGSRGYIGCKREKN